MPLHTCIKWSKYAFAYVDECITIRILITQIIGFYCRFTIYKFGLKNHKLRDVIYELSKDIFY